MESLFSGNPYFSAGAGILALTWLGSVAIKSSGLLTEAIKRRLIVSLEIPSRDPSYPWFLQYMATSQMNTKHIFQKLHNLSLETKFTRHVNGSINTGFSLVPGQGKHIFKYESAWFQVERTRERAMVDIQNGAPWETIMITGLSRDRGLFLQMLEEAKKNALAKEIGKTVVYTSYGHEWRPFGNPRRRRPLGSVVLQGDTAKSLLDDVDQFLTSSQWYIDRGIPYRRGYLLHGPPGSGKSSFIQSLAGQLEYNICIMNLAELGMTDDRFAHLLNNIPPRSFVLLEDIDAAFSSRTIEDAARNAFQSTLTLSGLLNGLDGVVAGEERVIFMTTNHLDRLDPALTRPGRVDRKIYVGNASEDQVKELFLRFYGPDNGEDDFVAKFNASPLKGKLSPAALQGHFVRHRDSPKSALEHFDEI